MRRARWTIQRKGRYQSLRARRTGLEFADFGVRFPNFRRLWPELNCDPLDFIERDFVLPAVIKLGRPRRFVVSDLLRDFEFAAVL
jgi:hypothetical protein